MTGSQLDKDSYETIDHTHTYIVDGTNTDIICIVIRTLLTVLKKILSQQSCVHCRHYQYIYFLQSHAYTVDGSIVEF